MFSLPGAAAPALRTKALDSGSDSLEDEIFVVAETQSFVLQSRDCHGSPSEGHIMEPTQQFGLDTDFDTSKSSDRGESFQLGLSDSSHLQDQVQQLAMESTQAFVSLQETQPYAAISHVDSQMSNMDAAHNSEEGMEPPVCSTVPETEGQVDVALEATQAYILDPYQESEDGTDDDDDEKNTAAAETQLFNVPLSLTIAMAETQPMCSSVNQVKPGSQNEAKEHRQAGEPQERSLNKDLTIAETQPMYECDDNDSDDEDSFPSSRKRKTKQLRIEDEQTQPLSSESSLPETQPMHNTVNETNATSGNEVNDEDHSVPGPRQRKTKALHLEAKKKQLLISSELSVAETQPMIAGDDGESDDLDTPLGPRNRKAKPLQIQEEETQTNSESPIFETKPEQAGTSGITATTKRRTRASLRGGPEKCDEPPKKQKRGKNKTSSTRRRRGKSKPSDDTSEEEEEVEQSEQSREIKSTGQQNNNDEEDKHAHNVSLLKEEEQRSGEKEDVTELRPEHRENTEENRIQIDEEENQLEREIKEKEEQESMQAERLRPARQRAKGETIQRVRKEQEEKERAERTQKDREEQLEREEKERLEHEKAEIEENERLETENARMENERKEQEEKERLETQRREVAKRLERERKDLEHHVRLELEAAEPDGKESPEKEKQEIEAEEKTIKEQRENKEENKAKVPARGRRSTRRTAAAMCTTGPEQDTANKEGPAMRTRSRSNSSNSVSSERSASCINTQDSKGRSRGKGARRTSEPTHTVISRNSNRRVTVAAESKQNDRNDVSQGRLSRSNSSSSLSSEISSSSLSSRGRGRGSRSHVRGRKEEPVYIPAVISQSDPKHRIRGMKSTKAEQSSHDDAEKTDSQQPTTTRGRWRSSGAELAGDENHSNQEGPLANEESLLTKKSVRGRGQKGVKSETVRASGNLTVNNRDEVKERITGRKRQLEANTEDESSRSSKIYKGKEQEQATEVPGEASVGQTKDDILDQADRKASISQTEQSTQLSANEVEVQENNERRAEKGSGKRGKARASAVQKKKKEEQEEIGASEDQHAHLVESEVT